MCKGSSGTARIDIYSAKQYAVPANGQTLCSTNIMIQVPAGCYARIASCSGLAVDHSIGISAGIVDPATEDH